MTRGPLLRPEPAGAEFVTLLTPPDWSAVFGGPGPLELEIGSGGGAFALGHAARHPEVRYVAIEWRKKYARELEHRARAQGLSNLRVVEADARAVIPRLFAPGSLAGIHLQFPDPWWKRAHRKRAILSPGFATLLLSLSAPGGVFDLRTDVQIPGRGDAGRPGSRRMVQPARRRQLPSRRPRGGPQQPGAPVPRDGRAGVPGPSHEAMSVVPSGVLTLVPGARLPDDAPPPCPVSSPCCSWPAPVVTASRTTRRWRRTGACSPPCSATTTPAPSPCSRSGAARRSSSGPTSAQFRTSSLRPPIKHKPP